MMKRITIITLLTISLACSAQRIAEDTYWYYFTDKSGNGYSLDKPGEFLSDRSVNRRAWQSLPVDETDLPVNRKYVDSLGTMGVNVLHVSKWLNGVLVQISDASLAQDLLQLTFLDSVPWEPDENLRYYPGKQGGERFEDAAIPAEPLLYGFSGDQVRQIEMEYLHEKGYTGAGVRIAVLDAGFEKLDSLRAFRDVVAMNRIVATRNFVHPGETVYDLHSHGTNVSSIIVGYWQDTLIGTAPDAEIILGLTENPIPETRIEEYSWIEGAEWADSLGADVINTSLGYTEFDDSTTNYTYRDMDGKTAHISIANSMTAGKGIISVTSAGNSGADPWYYIGAPADATDIISVGAVNVFGNLAGFSSRGPTYDHRIKPEVSAMGVLTVIQSTNGSAQLGFGTSFSSPVIAGAVAALWQAYPGLSSYEIIRRIIESADKYKTPDTMTGYGIPSFKLAFEGVTSSDFELQVKTMNVYPNPFYESFTIDIPVNESGNYSVTLYNLQGKMVYSGNHELPGRIGPSAELAPGLYIVEIQGKSSIFRTKITKK